MNDEQTKQWNQFACMSRALIAAAEAKKIALNIDQYRTKYEGLFPFPDTAYGGLFLSRFFFIARDIGLGRDMDLLWRYNDAKSRVDGGATTFVFSALHLEPGRSDDFCHTSFLEKIDVSFFRVNGLAIDLPASDWITKRCCGIVLF